MPVQFEPDLQRWVDARVIDAATAQHIRSFEEQHGKHSRRNWPMLIALTFGALMLGAGILLFVASHWENMAPVTRFSVVIGAISLLHAVAVVTARSSPQLSLTMHAIGTISSGAGIFLSGQIFNLQEHWPTGILLWAIAAALGWALLHHWIQAALTAVLIPAWLLSEWMEATRRYHGNEQIAIQGLLLLALAYLSARSPSIDSPLRIALNWIGALALVPAFLIAAFDSNGSGIDRNTVPFGLTLIGWIFSLLGPIAVAALLRGKSYWPMIPAAIWVMVFRHLSFEYHYTNDSLALYAWHSLGPYVWGAVGAAGLIAWGVSDRMKNRVNLGMILFVITLGAFYFSDLMDKVGRSVSLISFGILFLVVGYFLEKTRKRLITQIAQTKEASA
jgi:uncharacterized membrane protein